MREMWQSWHCGSHHHSVLSISWIITWHTDLITEPIIQSCEYPVMVSWDWTIHRIAPHTTLSTTIRGLWEDPWWYCRSCDPWNLAIDASIWSDYTDPVLHTMCHPWISMIPIYKRLCTIMWIVQSGNKWHHLQYTHCDPQTPCISLCVVDRWYNDRVHLPWCADGIVHGTLMLFRSSWLMTRCSYNWDTLLHRDNLTIHE